LRWSACGLLAGLTACSTRPPAQPENLCQIFREKPEWHKAALKMNEKWGTPIQVVMAMMYQESSFVHDAQPPMQYFLFIPTGRASSAYGYAQVKDETWADYQRETGNGWSDRDDFADAIDFMGWYTHKAQRLNGTSKWDAYGQYLNYHEGWGGYRRGSYRSKARISSPAGAGSGNQIRSQKCRYWTVLPLTTPAWLRRRCVWPRPCRPRTRTPSQCSICVSACRTRRSSPSAASTPSSTCLPASCVIT